MVTWIVVIVINYKQLNTRGDFYEKKDLMAATKSLLSIEW